MIRILTLTWPCNSAKNLEPDNPRRKKWFYVTKSSLQEFGGSKVNTTCHFWVFGRHVAMLQTNQYHDRTLEEMASYRLTEWVKAEKLLIEVKESNARLMAQVYDLQTRLEGTTADPELVDMLVTGTREEEQL